MADATPDAIFPPWSSLVKQAGLWTGVSLYDWQVDVLNAAQVPHSRALTSTANESGKSSIIAPIFLFGIAAAFPGASCHATSGNEEQLHDQLFTMLEEIAKTHGWKVKQQGMTITLPNGSTVKCSVKSDPRSAEGFHGTTNSKGIYCPCGYFADECKHVQNDTHNAIRRINPDFFLGCSTPPTEHNAKYDWFWKGIDHDHLDRIIQDRRKKLNMPKPEGVYTKRVDQMEEQDPIHSFPGEFFTYRRVVSWLECPHLRTPANKLERDNIKKEYGENSAFYRSMVLGMATDGDVESPIYTTEEVELMRTVAMVPGKASPQTGDIRVAADVSGTGTGDPMVLALRHGTHVLYFKEHMGMDDMAQADFLVDFCKKMNVAPHQFCIDGMGVGASVARRMEQTHGFWGMNLFVTGNDPIWKDSFADRFTELHWLVKDLLSYNVLEMTWCPGILRDMRERQYIVQPTGKTKTQSKKDHRKLTGHSSDWLDTLVYLFADFPMHLIRQGMQLKQKKKRQHPEDRQWESNHPEQGSSQSQILPGLIKQPSLASLMMAAKSSMNGPFSS